MSNRIYYANQQVGFKATEGAAWSVAHGVQSIGISTTFTLEQAFELGQLSIYENIEGIPEIECTVTKILDGHPLLYRLATQAASQDDIVNRAQATTFIALGIWPDNVTSAGNKTEAQPTVQVEMTGMAVSNVSYDLSVEGNFTESITLVGNDKQWTTDLCPTSWSMEKFDGAAELPFDGNDDVPIGTAARGTGVQRRENFNLALSTLPAEVADQYIQSISVSIDLSRESLFKLGSRRPYARVVNFPAEVSCDIEVLSVEGDQINALVEGCNPVKPCPGVIPNTEDRAIEIITCDSTTINIGSKCRLSAVNYGGGDAGGGNATVTYSYTTYSDFEVTHDDAEP